MRWAIVADDLTGAADAAVMFADAGIKTTVWLDEPEDFPEGSCCSVDADARWRNCRTASQLIRQHVSALNETDWLMLKIDSTLRGFVGAMVQAAWGASKRNWLLVAPAVPKQGRIVKCGHLFVRGKPITETDLAQERPAPITTSSVPERLRQTGFVSDGIRCVGLFEVRRERSLRETVARAMANGFCLVCDAETDKDLHRLMLAVLELPSRPLLVGASGLAKALVQATVKKPPKRKTLPFRPQKLLVIVGSQQITAQQQLKFLEAKGIPVTEMGRTKQLKLPDEKAVAVRLNLGDKCGKKLVRLRRWLADCLIDWLEREPFSALIIVGGLTARTTFEALGVRRWDLICSLLPGMPLGFVQFNERTLLVATKAGGFGTEGTLWQAVGKLVGRVNQ
ncbi:four-carbon acid sugar kinase family protein [Fervidibacter sacchari]